MDEMIYEGKDRTTIKYALATLLDKWKARTGVSQGVIAKLLGMAPSDFSKKYKDPRTPVPQEPRWTLAIIRKYSDDPNPQFRCSAGEALEFAILTQFPFDQVASLASLFPDAEWQKAWEEYEPVRRAASENGLTAEILKTISTLSHHIEAYTSDAHRQQLDLETRRIQLLEEVRHQLGIISDRQVRIRSEQRELRRAEQALANTVHTLEATGLPRAALALPTTYLTASLAYQVPQKERLYIERDEFDQIIEALNLNRRRYLVTIGGPAGVGKTTLATEIARYCQEHGNFTQIIWTTAQNYRFPTSAPNVDQPFSNFEGLLNEILRAFGCHSLLDDMQEEKIKVAIEFLADAPSLLVVDNADTIQDFIPFISFFDNVRLHESTKILLTSRTRRENIGEQWIDIPAMGRDSVDKLIELTCKQTGIMIDPKQIETLYAHLGGNPLAVLWGLSSFQHGKKVVETTYLRMCRLPCLWL